MPEIQKVKTARRERALAINRASLNEETRTVEAVFATETPCRSYVWGVGEIDEILDCQDSSFDGKRFSSGGQFLKEHDRQEVVGVIDSFRFENQQGVAVLRYAKTPLGEEEWGMMKDRIRNNFSVSYYVHKLQPESLSEEDGNVFRAVSWEGLEISVVSVPADPNCQAIRAEANQTHETTITDMKLLSGARALMHDKADDNKGADAFDAASERAKIKAELFKISKEIDDTAANFKRAGHDVDALAATAKEKDWTPDQFRAEAIKTMTPAEGQRAGGEVVTRPAGGNMELVRGEEMPAGVLQLVASKGSEIGFLRGARRKASVSIDIPGHAEFRGAMMVPQVRTTVSSSTISGYNGIVRIGNIIELGLQRPTVADLLSQGTTELRSVPYMQEVSFTPSAVAVSEGSAKAEQSFSLIQVNAPIEKVAAWTKVSDEIAEDMPAIQSYIQARLIYAVQIKEDNLLLNGSGTTPQIRGILNTSGIQTQALGSDTAPDAIYKGITKIRAVAFFEPDGLVVHPTNWQNLRLLKDGNLQYYGGGPFTGAYGNGPTVFVERFWGLPVVVTTAIASGTALVGAFKLGAMIWRRKGLTVDITNVDQNDFILNLMTIRAEERFGLEVSRPLAFCTVTSLP